MSNNAPQSLTNLKWIGDLMNTFVETINKTILSINSHLSTIPHPVPLRESDIPDIYIISVQDMEKCLM